MSKTKYIFVIGGVMSGVGKGVTTASIGRILKNRGFRVSAIKIDPYINVDAGTMNPVEHGEVLLLRMAMRQIKTSVIMNASWKLILLRSII